VLLTAAAKRGIAPGYVRQLLAKFRFNEDRVATNGSLAEPLSERELDVLRLLATDLDGPEIARELTVSLSTMRTHTRSIFNKLGVSSRRAAVRRAEELDLLSRTRTRRFG
jgi:LuxR family maltose regulon positive regulatory protein